MCEIFGKENKLLKNAHLKEHYKYLSLGNAYRLILQTAGTRQRNST